MGNYPQINLRRVLKGVDFGTFYNLVKSRPEVLEVIKEYEFNSNQTKQIIIAFYDGLTLEAIKSCAISRFDANQMSTIYEAYKCGLTVKQMELVLNPDFGHLQMEWIIKGIRNGWEEKKIKLYAKPEFEAEQMEEIYLAIRNGIGISIIRLFAKPEFVAEQMKKIRLAFTSWGCSPTYKQVKLLANSKLSLEQISQINYSFYAGLTFNQIQKFAKIEYNENQMEEIIKAYLEEFTNEQMAFILNSKLDHEQMNKIRTAVKAGLTNKQIATFSTGEYDYKQMGIIIEAYRYGVKPYVDLLLNPNFDIAQMEMIWKGCQNSGLTFEEIKYYAKEEIDCMKMQEIYNWFNDGFSIEQFEEYVDKFKVEQLEKIRYGLKNKLKYLELWVNPEFNECQMQEAIFGIKKGFTKEQLLGYLIPQLDAYYMSIVRRDIEAGVPLEKVSLYANCIDRKVFEKTRIKVLYKEIQKLIN